MNYFESVHEVKYETLNIYSISHHFKNKLLHEIFTKGQFRINKQKIYRNKILKNTEESNLITNRFILANYLKKDSTSSFTYLIY